MISSKRKLLDAIRALLPDVRSCSPAERGLLREIAPDSRLASFVRDAVRSGEDPLGNALLSLRSPEQRRRFGSVFTPKPIIEEMFDIAGNASPTRVVDPGAGSGRFTIEAAKRFPSAKIVAIEYDPLAALTLRASLNCLNLSGRVHVIVDDYRNVKLPRESGTTLFIGNPPYTRHHDIATSWKEWFATAAQSHNISASKLAGLHVHFFFKTAELCVPGDLGVFITSAEWLDVNYGRAVRELLVNGIRAQELLLFDPTSSPFADALTTGLITVFRAGSSSSRITVTKMSAGTKRTTFKRHLKDLQDIGRWSHLFNVPSVERPTNGRSVGDVFRVSRGQVTGMNRVWVYANDAPPLPEKFLVPCITDAKEIVAAKGDIQSVRHLKRVVDLPATFEDLSPVDRRLIDNFLKWARSLGADKTFIARHRKPWWRVRLLPAAPIVCTYMARGKPTFALNSRRVPLLNIGLQLYPKIDISSGQLSQVVNYLNQEIDVSAGRTYSGGLTKFEPNEMASFPLAI